MFTGLVEEKGKVVNISKKATGLGITIKGDKVTEKAEIGDSIAVNGVCLTVTELSGNTFTADVMYETIERSGLKRITAGETVNLEKSLTLTTFLGGHLVMGDVDSEAEIISIVPKGMKHVVEKGRVTIDGASLTVIDTDDDAGTFSVSLIPHTLENITLGKKKVGDYVNIETDLFGKYVEKILKFNNAETEKTEKSGITMDFLQKNGF